MTATRAPERPPRDGAGPDPVGVVLGWAAVVTQVIVAGWLPVRVAIARAEARVVPALGASTRAALWALCGLQSRLVPVLARLGRGVVTALVDAETRVVPLFGATVTAVGTGVHRLDRRLAPPLSRLREAVAGATERLPSWVTDGTKTAGRPVVAVASATAEYPRRLAHQRDRAWRRRVEERRAMARPAGGFAFVARAPVPLAVRLRRAGLHTMRATGLLTATLIALLAFGLVAGQFGRYVAGATGEALNVNLALPQDAQLARLPERSVVYDSKDRVLAVLHDEVNRRVVSLDRISQQMQNAVIAAEDREFYEHAGYDLEALGRAAVANIKAQDVTQGGSTISQQLAKQNFAGDEQSLERKFTELLYSIALEKRFSKDELLTRYLNQVYFGSGSYGVAAAAEDFFGKQPKELNAAEGALLAGAIRSPSSLDAHYYPKAARRRRNQVLSGMAAEGHLTRQQARHWKRTPLNVVPEQERPTDEPYFVAAVKREFLANPAFGATRAERRDQLFSGGLRIYATIDRRMQKIADEVVDANFPIYDGATAAIASVDPRTGRVLALHGGEDFDEEQFDLAAQGRRQPGSAFKPFVMATALKEGFPVGTRLTGQSPTVFPVEGPDWEVGNYGGASYGSLTIPEALVNSVNTAFAQLMLAVGPADVIEQAERMGIDMDAATGGVSNPSLALGGFDVGVTPLEMSAAFATFANGGKHQEPHFIDIVRDTQGRVVYRADTSGRRVLSPAVNAVMVETMQQVVSRGTGTRAQLYNWEEAGKTGTTQDYSDAWFIGYTPVLSTAVWIGHPDSREPMYGVTGGSYPASTWRQFMEAALSNRQPIGFKDVSTNLSEVATGKVSVPDVTGVTESTASQRLLNARLVAEPQTTESDSPSGTIVWQSPDAGDTAEAGDPVYLGVSSGYEPEPEPEPPTRDRQPATRESPGAD
ncbi:hypothetical protein BH20ACT9_BH20ACT9_14250 [soil metagenome]